MYEIQKPLLPDGKVDGHHIKKLIRHKDMSEWRMLGKNNHPDDIEH